MKDEFTEAEKVADQVGIRQGDVLVNLDEKCDPWDRWALVITADCDLALQKCGGIVSCVPIVGWKEYMTRFVLVTHIGGLRLKVLSKLTSRINKLRNAADRAGSVSSRGVEIWLDTGDPARPAFDVALQNDPQTKELSAFLRRTKDLNDFDEMVHHSAKGHQILGEAKDEVSASKIIRSKFADKLKRLPGDSMFFNSVVEDERGQVAYLRRIYALSETEISPKAWGLDQQVRFVRIGRIRAPFKQHAAQRIGAMFDSIGLPNSYESELVQFAAEIVEAGKERTNG